MSNKLTIFLVATLSYNFIFVASLFEDCDSDVNLVPSTKHAFESTNFTVYDVRKKYATGTSCRVHYIAPHGNIIRVRGRVALDVDSQAPNCQAQSQKFLISRNGNKNFSDADYFCSSHAVALESIGNEMTVGYISEPNGQGKFQTFAEAVKIDKYNCNCGWGLYSNFGKFQSSRRYQGFTSTVGVLHAENDEIVCTGVIIHYNYVLSSAHCYFKSTSNVASALQIIAGYREYPSEIDKFYQSSYPIESITIHELYSDEASSQSNDIALIKVKNPIRFSRGVSPVCLPIASSFLNNLFYVWKRFEFVGWSKYNNDGLQQFLRDSIVSYLDPDECLLSFKAVELSNSQLCIKRNNETIYPQYPGSALFYTSGHKKFLVGLYNLKIESTETQPIVFTRIANFMPWIKKNLKNEFLCYRYF